MIGGSTQPSPGAAGTRRRVNGQSWPDSSRHRALTGGGSPRATAEIGFRCLPQFPPNFGLFMEGYMANQTISLSRIEPTGSVYTLYCCQVCGRTITDRQ